MYLVPGEGLPQGAGFDETWRLQTAMDERRADFLLPRQFSDDDRDGLIRSLPLAYDAIATIMPASRLSFAQTREVVTALDDVRRIKSENMRVVFRHFVETDVVQRVRDQVECAVAVAAKSNGARYLEVLEATKNPKILDLKKFLPWT